MKSRHSAVSGSACAQPTQAAMASPGQQAGGRGNAAAQEALHKRMGGGTWTVQSGDTLSRIAARSYGNAALWDAIRDSNPDRVKDGGRLIYVGTVLDIPEIDGPDPSVATPAADTKVDAAVDPAGECPAAEPVSRVTDFGHFEIYPDDFEGTLPRSGDGIQRVHQWRFAEIEAEAQAEGVEADIAALDDDVSFEEPVVVTIAGEQVRVSSKAEAQHAAQMFKEMHEVYGVRVDSAAGVEAVKARYTKVPSTELDKLATKEWEYKEVLGFHRALEHFAPILGARREDSAYAGTEAGVGVVSKVNNSINDNVETGKIDNETLGEYFGDSKTVSIFAAGTDSEYDFKGDNQKQLEATAIHELAHGLLKQELEGYRKATGYWATDQKPAIDTTFAEAPVSRYGCKNAAEDLSEATMYYFTDPETLRSKCPTRYAYIHRIVSGWSQSQP